jgi:hypothetical protein
MRGPSNTHKLSFPEYNGNEELSQWLYKCHLEAYMEGKGDPTLGFSLGRLGLGDTTSRGKIVKETLSFSLLKPAVPWRNSQSTFLCFEDVFLLGNLKIHFLIFTVLPLNLFWS